MATASDDSAVHEELSWERANAAKAAIAAVAGGLLTLLPPIYVQSAALSDRPVIGELQALTPALQGRVEAGVNPRTAVAEFYAHHSTPLIVGGVLSAIGVLAIGYALLYLFRATAARRPELPQFARWVIVVGVALSAIAGVAVPIAQAVLAKDYVNAADRSRQAIDDALRGTPIVIVASMGYAGGLALALSFVLLGLNAMRAGLLTRFMGILGMIVGALYIIPIGPLPVIQAFWIAALGALFLRRWPSGTPPAWESGVAVPWPSSAQVREERMRAQGKAAPDPEPGEPTPPAPTEDVDPTPPPPRPSGPRKRRKRR